MTRIPVHVESNGKGCLAWLTSLPGAYTRGETEEEALSKVPPEVQSYLRWRDNREFDELVEPFVIARTTSRLQTEDADSDLLLEGENAFLPGEYEALCALALRSAMDFKRLYDSIPDHEKTCIPERRTFYGLIPRTAREMYRHVNECTAYYLCCVGIEFWNTADIVENRRRALALLTPSDRLYKSEQDDEFWTVKKVLRRFLWHDRIHAKAMYRMATALYGTTTILNPFCFRFGTRVSLPVSDRLKNLRLAALARQIPVTDEETLALLCEKAKSASRILEIGTAVGLSAIAMAEVAPSARIVTLEKNEEFAIEAERNFKEFGFDDRITLLQGDAAELLPALRGSFDFIFLDGPKAQYIHYFPVLKQLLSVGGTLFSDDVLLYGWVEGIHEVPHKRSSLVARIRDYLALLQADQDFKTEILKIGEGVALSVKQR